ncbi:DUF4352 domain-containing protein [Bacillus sp. JZ8]
MWKKLSVVGMSSALALSLAACGSDSSSTEEKSSAKSDVIEASIKDATYVISDQDDGQSQGAETGLMEVDIKVENKTNSSISIDSYDGIKLYDGDEQIDPVDVYDSGVGLESSNSGSIGGKKVKDVKYYFEVEKDQSYKIGLKPRTKDYDEEAEEVMLKLDTKKYDDSFNSLQDPAKAVKAYISTLYLDKEDKNYDKLVTADKGQVQQLAKETFTEKMDSVVSPVSLNDSDVNKYYDSYKVALAERAKVEPKVVSKGKDKAVVELQYSTISLSDVYDELNNYAKDYRKENSTFDMEESMKYALTKFDKVLKDVTLKTNSYEEQVELKEKDGKWEINSDSVESLNDIFSIGY